MIGKLKGVIEEINEDHCVIDVHGVGYVAFCSSRTLSSLTGVGSHQVLFVETYVREDALRLFGFYTSVEREWFRLLMAHVQGVGARVALAILSTLSSSELSNALALRDGAMFSRVPGVGKKVAERIITELRNKILPVSEESDSALGLKNALREGIRGSISDAVSALIHLGYSRDRAADAVASVYKSSENTQDSAVLIKLALKELSA